MLALRLILRLARSDDFYHAWHKGAIRKHAGRLDEKSKEAISRRNRRAD
jgi:hypothetical protein